VNVIFNGFRRNSEEACDLLDGAPTHKEGDNVNFSVGKLYAVDVLKLIKDIQLYRIFICDCHNTLENQEGSPLSLVSFNLT